MGHHARAQRLHEGGREERARVHRVRAFGSGNEELGERVHRARTHTKEVESTESRARAQGGARTQTKEVQSTESRARAQGRREKERAGLGTSPSEEGTDCG